MHVKIFFCLHLPISVCILLWFTLDGLGRRWLLSLSLGLLGTTSIILALIPKDYTTIILITYLFSE